MELQQGKKIEDVSVDMWLSVVNELSQVDCQCLRLAMLKSSIWHNKEAGI